MVYIKQYICGEIITQNVTDRLCDSEHYGVLCIYDSLSKQIVRVVYINEFNEQKNRIIQEE
jgi:hypothetical protein